MNVNIALDLDTVLDEVMSPQRLRIWTNTAKQLVTHGRVRGPLMYLEFVDFRYICDAKICDELTVISSVEAIP